MGLFNLHIQVALNIILVVKGFSGTTDDIKRTTPGTNISSETAQKKICNQK